MASNAATLDPERIAMLRDLDDGGSELLATLAREFERDARNQLASAQEALATTDASALDRCAHTLKGASANLGAEALAELCRGLQERAQVNDLAGAADLVASIEGELDRVAAALHELLAEV